MSHDDGASSLADDDAPLDPALGAAIVAEQRALVRERTDVDARLIFGAWGVAWVVGFGLMGLEATGALELPRAATGAVFGLLLVAAGVLTAVHIGVRSAGLRGTSSVQGAMYGWAWALGFAGVTTLGVTLAREGVDPEVMATVMTIASTTLVAGLYMAGGAVWNDRVQFTLGAWIGITTIVATVIGYPAMQLVMAVAGGGGMLVAALVDHLRRRRLRARRAAVVGGAGR